MARLSIAGAYLRPLAIGLAVIIALVVSESWVETVYAGKPSTLYEALFHAEPHRRWLRGLTALVILALSYLVGRILLRQHNMMAALSEKNLELQKEVILRKKMEGEYSRLTVTDMLTGIGNRRKFEQDLATALARERRASRDLFLFMCDVDHFKKINDCHGHDVGDRVLVKLAEVWGSALRETDSIYRIGGEEFVILAHCDSWDGAGALAGKLAEALEATNFFPVSSVTASIGVAALAEFDTPQSLYKRADEALYEVKCNGRNNFKFKKA